MCATCGCSEGHEHDPERLDHAHPRGAHPHAHPHPHDHDPGEHAHEHGTRTVRLERDLLEKNDAYARENRAWLARRGVLALNLVGAPGAGKTTLVEATIRALGPEKIAVIEGDQATDRDSARIRATGARALQITTGTGCHLDAHQVGFALAALAPPARSIVIIENVGNLVCPALFDLGEHAKVTIVSTPEGDDKPLKYPHMFRASRALVINKMDLLPYVPFDVARCAVNARAVNPHIDVLRTSSSAGAEIDAWVAWIRARLAATPARGVDEHAH